MDDGFDAVLERAAVYEEEAQRLQALLSDKDTDPQMFTLEAETGGGEVQRLRAMISGLGADLWSLRQGIGYGGPSP